MYCIIDNKIISIKNVCGPFYEHGLTLIQAISDCIHHKVCGKMMHNIENDIQ